MRRSVLSAQSRARRESRPGREPGVRLRWRGALLVLPLALGSGLGVRADMGVPLGSGLAGAYRIDVIAFPAPLRVGDGFFSVLVRDPGTGAVRSDLGVVIEIRSADEDAASATLAFSAETRKHPGFYSARIPFAGPGLGLATIRVMSESGASEEAALDVGFDVLPPAEPWREHAGAILFPFGLLAIFVWHQRRSHDRQTRRRSARSGEVVPAAD